MYRNAYRHVAYAYQHERACIQAHVRARTRAQAHPHVRTRTRTRKHTHRHMHRHFSHARPRTAAHSGASDEFSILPRSVQRAVTRSSPRLSPSRATAAPLNGSAPCYRPPAGTLAGLYPAAAWPPAAGATGRACRQSSQSDGPSRSGHRPSPAWRRGGPAPGVGRGRRWHSLRLRDTPD